MARRKIRPKLQSGARNLRYWGRGKAPIERKIGSTVTVAPDIRFGFMACAELGGRRHGPSAFAVRRACKTGRNPRKAVAAALRDLARKIGKRGGAFAGFQVR